MLLLRPGWLPRRSVLFLPASNGRAVAKAATLACDAVIFDLEDSVAPGMAALAHANLREAAGLDFGRRERIVRVGAPGGAGFAADLAAAGPLDPDAFLLPKVDDAATIRLAAERLEAAGSRAGLWAMVETPRAILCAAQIAAAHPRLKALVIGPNDLARATGVPLLPGRAAFIPWFMTIIAAARANGLCVLDGVFNRFADVDGFTAECAQAVTLGFDGKTLIHPSQVAPANAAFSPAERDYAAARRIADAFALPQNRDLGAIALDGEMVERLHLESALRLLQLEAQLRP